MSRQFATTIIASEIIFHRVEIATANGVTGHEYWPKTETNE